MWEWSNRILNKKRPKAAKTLQEAYNDLLLPNSLPPSEMVKNQDIAAEDSASLAPPGPEEMLRILEKRLTEFNLKNFTLREASYEPQNWQEMDSGYIEYRRIREVFLKLLGYSHINDCQIAGLTKADIKLLRRSIAPENFDVHMKIPFDFGGTLDFNNLCLIQTHPRHDLVHRLIDMQIENNYLRTYKKIYLPWFDGRIYHD